jgi:N-sulfoglucosamine sulfohydrolase
MISSSRKLFTMRILFFCLALLCAASAHIHSAERPNILMMLSDDHSYPYVSAYGDTNVKTPTLDRLAADGIKFHRFFTACPQCVPSRAAYMTGRSPVAARMTRFTSPLDRREVAFPEILREKAGYFTGICGRNYHLDGAARSTPEIRQL